MILLARIFASFFAILVIAQTYNEFKRGKEPLAVFLFWSITWALIVSIAFYPQIIDWLIQKLGGQRTGLGTVFGMGLVFLFYVIYRIYLKADRIEKELTKLNRELALRDLKDSRDES